ncbi:hypothetical protein Pelo_11229 [Pelomyxa schiedti]|nr:hypothetical protein Pelo_11229 [Pelomyxa schiedti]
MAATTDTHNSERDAASACVLPVQPTNNQTAASASTTTTTTSAASAAAQIGNINNQGPGLMAEGVLLCSDVHLGRSGQGFTAQSLIMGLLAGRPEKVLVLGGDLVEHAVGAELEEASDLVARAMRDLRMVVICTIGNHEYGGAFFEGVGHLGLSSRSVAARAKVKQMFSMIALQADVAAFNAATCDTITRVGDDIFVALCSYHGVIPQISASQIQWASDELQKMGVPKVHPNEDSRNNLSSSDCSKSPETPHHSPTYSESTPKLLTSSPLLFPLSYPTPSRSPRLHLVTHHSVWKDSEDSHRHMENTNRLTKTLLIPFGFSTVINGHNHRYVYKIDHLPNTKYNITRISIPSISNKTRGCETGVLSWDPSSSNPPQLLSPNSSSTTPTALSSPRNTETQNTTREQPPPQNEILHPYTPKTETTTPSRTLTVTPTTPGETTNRAKTPTSLKLLAPSDSICVPIVIEELNQPCLPLIDANKNRWNINCRLSCGAFFIGFLGAVCLVCVGILLWYVE